MAITPAQVVLAWLNGLNAGDISGVLASSAPNVELHGPRGTGRGRELLRTWLANSGAQFETRALYAAGDTVVVAQHGVWRDTAGAVTGEADVTTRFRVANDLVAELQRYDDMQTALRDAGLSSADAQPPSSARLRPDER